MSEAHVRGVEALSAQAIDLMKRHRSPPLPNSYELWFAYAAQDNAALVDALNETVANGLGGELSHLRQLHARFFGPAAGEALSEINAGLSEELARLGKTLEQSGADTREYGRALKIVGEELTKTDIGPRLKDIVATVAAATHAMEVRNKALETQLNTSLNEVGQLRGRMETLRRESLSDGLTGLANRRCFDERLQAAASEARAGTPFSLVIGDIDHFKRFNDTWGHATGDQVLRLVAQCFKTNVRETDTAARYGGEEIVVILPGTGLDDATRLAERIRSDVASKKIVKRSSGESLGTITLSLGVAEFNGKEDVGSLVNRADACLYAGKHAGRNCVVSERTLDDVRARSAAGTT